MKKIYRKGEIVDGIVSNVTHYGGFVHIDFFTNGLIHISEITNGFVSDIHQYLKIGQKVVCKVLEVDEEKGQLKLSLKHLPLKPVQRTFPKYKYLLKDSCLPKSNIGFKSIEENLPKWIKENSHVKV